MRRPLIAALLLAFATPRVANAEVGERVFDAGGYIRLMTRPDFQGGDSKLGFWTLYGRLLNEGPFAQLDLRADLLPQRPGELEPWTSLHARIEGGSVGNASPALGRLDAFALSQLYLEAGNVLLDRVTFRLGTLDYYLGDLGLFDMRPAEIFLETLGLSASYERNGWEARIGLGDSGYFLRRDEYNTIFTFGGCVRWLGSEHVSLGLGGQVLYEPKTRGNRLAPHTTPDVDYEDFLRGQVVERFLEDNPGQEDFFTSPTPVNSVSYKAIAHVGFGGLGVLTWNDLFASVTLKHPDNFVVEEFNGENFSIFVNDLTDERSEIRIGDQLQLRLVPRRLDVAIAFIYGRDSDQDNDVAPSDRDRTFYSTVLRLQTYLTPTVHVLAETSYAVEESSEGNQYRAHADSVFESTGGVADSEGLEFGDLDTRKTWQGKIGFVLNPTGVGIFTRPSLRVLYGVQHSNQTNAFGTQFVSSLDELGAFGAVERHWHHLVALEGEAWF